MSKELATTFKKSNVCLLIDALPQELHLCVLTFLRAADLSAVQRTCQYFNDRELIHSVVEHTATYVYPPDLTEGFDTPVVGGHIYTRKSMNDNSDNEKNRYYHTFEVLRNMEMLVVARVLSRPEPSVADRDGCFYVSKSWCRAALRWLEAQQEERDQEMRRRLAESQPAGKKGRKKGEKRMSKKEQRMRQRRLSDVMPPWPNVNSDIMCEHGDLKHCGSKQARARRRIMDKQAWKVLKKLYPESVQLCGPSTGCLHCVVEAETQKKTEADLKEKEKVERRRPLTCPLIRNFYTRHGGVPKHCLISPVEGDDVVSDRKIIAAGKVIRKDSEDVCPLVPGVYHALPRAWCHRWRKYLKNGDGERPNAPDASALLCRAHKLPLIPPHLEAFLYGDSLTLLGRGGDEVTDEAYDGQDVPPARAPIGLNPVQNDSENADVSMALRAAGISELELQAQRLAMLTMERELRSQQERPVATLPVVADKSPCDKKGLSLTNAQLDRENGVVVEILTDEEFSALLQWWPEIHSSYALSFAVTVGSSSSSFEIVWNTLPCRECDATGKACKDIAIRNRARGWVKRGGDY